MSETSSPSADTIAWVLERTAERVGYRRVGAEPALRGRFGEVVNEMGELILGRVLPGSSLWIFTGTMRRREMPAHFDFVAIVGASRNAAQNIEDAIHDIHKTYREITKKPAVSQKATLAVYIVSNDDTRPEDLQVLARLKKNSASPPFYIGEKIMVRIVVMNLRQARKTGNVNNVFDSFAQAVMQKVAISRRGIGELIEQDNEDREYLGENYTAVTRIWNNLGAALNAELIAYQIRNRMTFGDLAVIVGASATIGYTLDKLLHQETLAEIILSFNPEEKIPIAGALVHPIFITLAFCCYGLYFHPFTKLARGSGTLRETIYTTCYGLSLIYPFNLVYGVATDWVLQSPLRQAISPMLNIGDLGMRILYIRYLADLLSATHDFPPGKRRLWFGVPFVLLFLLGIISLITTIQP